MNDPSTPPLMRVPSWVWWCVILCVVVGIAWRTSAAADDGPAPAGAANEVQARYVVGLKAIGSPLPPLQLGQLLDELAAAGPVDAMRAAAVATELLGHEAGRGRLDPIVGTTDEERRVHVLLAALWAEEKGIVERAASLAQPDRAVIVDLLGWSGRLALTPDGADEQERAEVMAEAKTTAVSLFSAAGAASLVGCIGVLLLLIGVVLAFARKLSIRYEPRGDASRVLLAMFAVWIVAFPVLSALAALAAPPGFEYVATLAASVTALAVGLYVPQWCGVSWGDVRASLGWTRGRGLVREVGAGFVAYLTMLPLLVGGLIATAGIAALVDRITGAPPGTALRGAAHPIALEMGNGSVAQLALVFVLAVVGAPFIEETFFRGALFGHLRGATARWSRGLSFALAATVNALVFAAIHPQGLVAIPILGGIALGLSLAREWRGSLIAPMTAHALSNAIALTVTLLVL